MHFATVYGSATVLDVEPMDYDWRQQADFMLAHCKRQGLRLDACCVEGLPMSRCIDGPALEELHPKGERCSQAKASGQRPLCGCTASKDIGWYSQVCGGGCPYCYASPAKLPPIKPPPETKIAHFARASQNTAERSESCPQDRI